MNRFKAKVLKNEVPVVKYDEKTLWKLSDVEIADLAHKNAIDIVGKNRDSIIVAFKAKNLVA